MKGGISLRDAGVRRAEWKTRDNSLAQTSRSKGEGEMKREKIWKRPLEYGKSRLTSERNSDATRATLRCRRRRENTRASKGSRRKG